ncbi:MAG TPA: aminotransferase class I/II-fold pyridoxal phosphate-dependent enzyme [Thermoleophilaceae bacterium]|nr:aminotransferase class I/II-fold pyridoxal phosphate-dependent enzyme [Thermoleophilaceae bacterium]
MSRPETTIFTTMTALAESTGAINLGQGFPDEDGPAAVIDAAVAALRGGENQYAPLPGIPALRAAVCAHQSRCYGIELDPETDVQVTFGATEALASALLALVSAGDEVAMLDPSYDSYAAVVALAGGVPRPIPLSPPAWRVTADAVAEGVSDRTRVLLINSPHNPTGRVLDAEELDLLAAACREHDVIALTDEVYEHLVYDGTHVPIATRPGMAERTITVSSLGKTHSFTGWKIGWATGPAELVGAVRGVKQYLTFAGGTPLQHAAAVALDRAAEEPAALAASLAEKRDLLSAGLRAAGFDVFPTAGTYFLTADARPLGFEDAVALCERLPLEAGVVAIPTSAFTADPIDRTRSLLRFAFCKRREVLEDAIARIGAWSSHEQSGPAHSG